MNNYKSKLVNNTTCGVAKWRYFQYQYQYQCQCQCQFQFQKSISMAIYVEKIIMYFYEYDSYDDWKFPKKKPNNAAELLVVIWAR